MTASLRPAGPGALEGRLATLVEAYDRQGLHRSATDVDQQSAEWLLDCARGLGVQATKHGGSGGQLIGVSLGVDDVIPKSVDDRLCLNIENARCLAGLISKPLGKGPEFLGHVSSQLTVTE